MTAFAVTCQTCHVKVWEGDQAPEDGQTVLSAYADSAAGNACPSKVDPCPNKSAAAAERAKRKPATLGDLDDLKKRLAVLEARS